MSAAAQTELCACCCMVVVASTRWSSASLCPFLSAILRTPSNSESSLIIAGSPASRHAPRHAACLCHRSRVHPVPCQTALTPVSTSHIADSTSVCLIASHSTLVALVSQSLTCSSAATSTPLQHGHGHSKLHLCTACPPVNISSASWHTSRRL